MEPSDLQLQVWREVCRHIEIGDSVERIAPILLQRLPLSMILVRIINLKRECVETVAGGQCGAAPLPQQTHNRCPAEDLERLVEWCRREELAHAPAADVRRQLPGLLPDGLDGDVITGPLHAKDVLVGAMVLVAWAGETFASDHVLIAESLLEPFTVAIENDRRLDEIKRLQQTAEADRQSLLTRLGRQNISESIVGADTGLRSVMERVELVAHTDAPVLIFGETGSGKEVIARAIHSRSRRAAGPFLRANCGAIPSELIDSELFGHERGSFTGAINMRQGWFERADGGTLFLDEIGELPLAAQVRLLRILQDGTFERVGGQRQLKVDVRIVGATHRDLQRMVAEGRFREDLWYRLAVFPIHLLPLRDRVEDIPALANHFALRAARRFGMPQLLPTPDDINLLAAYAWPGNIRELATVMERAAILGNGHKLEIAKSLGAVTLAAPPAAEPTGNGNGAAANPDSPTSTPFASLDAAMAAHIQAALRRARGRVEGPRGAAKLLNINPHTLRARMRKLKIDWSHFRDDAE